MNQDIKIIRELAKQYAYAANQPKQRAMWQLHADVNDLKPQRPVALIGELPWHELNIDNALTYSVRIRFFGEWNIFSAIPCSSTSIFREI